MEGVSTVSAQVEYVIHLQEGDVLQSQDLNQLVNVAVIDSSTTQEDTVTAHGNVAVLGDTDMNEREQIGEISLLSNGLKNQSLNSSTSSKISPSNVVFVKNVNNDFESDDVMRHMTQETNVPRSIRGEQIVEELTDLGSETLVASSDVIPANEKREMKAARKRQISLISQRPGNISKQPAVIGIGDHVEINAQPFTIETLKSCYPDSRLHNRARTIYDYLMYEKFPEGYTNNQKQTLRDLRDNYIIVDGKLYYRQKKDNSIYLLLVIYDEQPEMQLEILRDGHMTKAGAHLGINRTIGQIKNYFYWHGVTEHVRSYIKSCDLCSLKYSLAREREKYIQFNMQTNSNFGRTSEGIAMCERIDNLSCTLKKLQSNLISFKTHAWLQKLKEEVLALNCSISLHKNQKQFICGDIPKVVTKTVSTGSENNYNTEREPAIDGEKGDTGNPIQVMEKEGLTIGHEITDESKYSRRIVAGKEALSKAEELKMLETMLPRNREHNHSRMIEEIIRTNKYPEQLTPGQVVGLAQVKTHYIMINDELYRVFSKRGKMQNVAKVIHDDDPELKRKIMKVYHVEENGKHNGMNKTICRLNESFHWHSMSMHVKIFLEYCPICRHRRGLSKTANAGSHVAKTNDIADICRKIANTPKDVYQVVPDNLDLTSEDYKEVKRLAEEVKDLNAWLCKNPTIKEEWEYMYETNSRGSRLFGFEREGHRRSADEEQCADKEKNKDNENYTECLKTAATLVELNQKLYGIRNDGDEGLKDKSNFTRSGEIHVPNENVVVQTRKVVTEQDNGLPAVEKYLKPNSNLKVSEEICAIKHEQKSILKVNSESLEETNAAKSVPKIVRPFNTLEGEVESLRNEEIQWNVNLDDSADDSVDEMSADGSHDDTEDNIEDENGDDETVSIDGNLGPFRKNDPNPDLENSKSANYFRDKMSAVDKRNTSIHVSDKERISEHSKESGVEDHIIDNTGQKSTYLSNLQLAKTADVAKGTDIEEGSGKDTRAGIRTPKSADKIRRSNRIKSNANTKQSAAESESTSVSPKHTVQLGQNDKVLLAGKPAAEEDIVMLDLRSDTPARKSTRKRVVTERFSGFFKSKRKAESATEPFVKNINQSQENSMSIDNPNAVTCTNDERQIQKQRAAEKLTPDKTFQGQLKCKSNTGSVAKAKPIMTHSVIRQSKEIKTNKTNCKMDGHESRGKKIKRSDSDTGTKPKGVMKNSDVHVIKRKITGIQSVKSVFQKRVRHSPDDVPKTKNNDDCIAAEVIGTENKNIIVPRSRRGLMMKNNISVVKKLESANVPDKLSGNKDELTIPDATLFPDKQAHQSDGGSKSDITVSPVDTTADTSRQLHDSKTPQTTDHDSSKNTIADQTEQIRQRSEYSNQMEIKSSELPMKYSIYLRKTKLKSDFVENSDSSMETITTNPNVDLNSSVDVKESILNNTKTTFHQTGNQNTHCSKIAAVKENTSRIQANEIQAQNGLIIVKMKSAAAENGGPNVNELKGDVSKFKIIYQKKDSTTIQNSQGVNSGGNTSINNIPEVEQDNRLISNDELEIIEGPTITQRLECPLCMKMFEDEKSYILHKGERCSFTCSYCYLEFKSSDKDNLVAHLHRHETVENHQCPDCERLFCDVALLNVHRRIHASDGMIICADCSTSVYSYFDLSVHCEAKHVQALVFICDLCSARYGSREFLVERRFAEGILSFYSCALCVSKI